MKAERRRVLKRILTWTMASALAVTSVSLPTEMVRAEGEEITEHHYDDNGFCTDAGCTDIYEPAVCQVDEADHEYYEIGNAGQLYWFADYINASIDHAQTNAKLTEDIVVNEGVMTAETDPAEVRQWIPIGNYEFDAGDQRTIYAGVFDGQNHTISGLYYAKTTDAYGAYAGLFGYLDMVAGSSGSAYYIETVKNLGVVNSYFKLESETYSAQIGAICGYGGYFWNCYSENNVIHAVNNQEKTSTIYDYSAYAGGIVGCLWSGGMRNCFSANNTLTATVANAGNQHAANPLAGFVNSNYVKASSMPDNYYLAEETTNDGGRTAEQCETGEVAYLLNQGANDGEIIWHQTLGEDGDAHPVLDTAHGVVHLKEDGTYTNEHILDITPGKEATCTESGLTEGSKCTVCGEVVTEQTVIPATGHSFTNYVSNNDATCISPGTKTAQCDNGCGAKDTIEDETQPATGIHDFTGAYVSLGAEGHYQVCIWCGAAGEKVAHVYGNYVNKDSKNHTHICACGYSEDAEHEWNEGKVTSLATCAAKGEVVYNCRECSAVKREEIAINPQNHTGNTEIRNAKEATCTEAGYTGDIYCKDCGVKLADGKTIPETGHTYSKYVVRATTKKKGSSGEKCSKCGAVRNVKTIHYAETLNLAKTSYTYNGKVKKPAVTVKDSEGNKISSSYYTVSYSNNKNVGKATVKVTFKGNYTGKLTSSFTIVPKTASISKITAQSRGFTVKWKKQSTQTSGYQIQYSTNSKFKGKTTKHVVISKNSTISKKIGKLSAKKKYYVRIRIYKTVKVNGKSTRIYSDWSKAKTVKTKK